MKVRNCLTCVNFVKQIVYEYNKSGTIVNLSHIMKCDKLNINFQMKNSEEKYDNEGMEERHFISNKCYKAKHYKKIQEISPYNIISKDV